MAGGINIHKTIFVMVDETEEAEASGFFIACRYARGASGHIQNVTVQYI
jgi:hypothetical protein